MTARAVRLATLLASTTTVTTFAAWVQNARRLNGEWKEYGVQQRSKAFSSQDAATRWAYQTANERISKL
jgi:hypothetical protein